MAEYSYFWDCAGAVGDGALGPYSNDEFSDVWASLAQFDRRSTHLVFSDLVDPQDTTRGYVGWFEINVDLQPDNGGTITVGNGLAIVDGKAYRLVNPQTFGLHAIGYYRIVLTKRWGDQTVRLGFIFSSISSGSTLMDQEDGVEWEVSVITAQVALPDKTLTVDRYAMPLGSDEGGLNRWFNTNPVVGGRQGGNAADWATGGVVDYITPMTRVEIGTIAVSGNPTTVTFANAFPNTPVVLIMPYDSGADWTGNNIWVSAISATQFSVSYDATTNLEGFFFMAFGPVT